MNNKIYFAPLQGYTEFLYRNAYNNFFTGIDTYYTPYVTLDNKGNSRKKYLKDISATNNQNLDVIPQVLCNTSDELLYWDTQIKQEGFSEINLNFGCPYPMVANKKKGAGIFLDLSLVEKMLSQFFEKSDTKISIKTRLGYNSNTKIFELIKILNKFNIKELIIHPRTGKQIYKGKIDYDIFKQCLNSTNIPICYNGDINSVEVFNQIKNDFPTINHFMLGRGLLKNPFLAEEIKTNTKINYLSRLKILKKFHDYIYNYYLENLCGETQILNKAKPFWEYFSEIFPAEKKECIPTRTTRCSRTGTE